MYISTSVINNFYQKKLHIRRVKKNLKTLKILFQIADTIIKLTSITSSAVCSSLRHFPSKINLIEFISANCRSQYAIMSLRSCELRLIRTWSSLSPYKQRTRFISTQTSRLPMKINIYESMEETKQWLISN